MTGFPPGFGGGALRLMLIVSACWVVFVFFSNYAGCRAFGFGQVMCFIGALVFSAAKVGLFVVETVSRLITLIMP